jgi:hypothetical protein
VISEVFSKAQRKESTIARCFATRGNRINNSMTMDQKDDRTAMN